jgi:hypothetical protein
MLAVLCAQVGVVEDINHEVYRSLLESQESCTLHLQVTLSGHVVYNLLNKMLEGGFPDEEIYCLGDDAYAGYSLISSGARAVSHPLPHNVFVCFASR